MLEAIDTAEESRRGGVDHRHPRPAVVGPRARRPPLQYVFNAIWQVTGRGIKAKLVEVLWLVGAGLLFLASVSLAPLLNWLPGPPPSSGPCWWGR